MKKLMLMAAAALCGAAAHAQDAAPQGAVAYPQGGAPRTALFNARDNDTPAGFFSERNSAQSGSFYEVGAGLLDTGGKGGSQYGVQAVYGGYFGQTEMGAFRLAGSVGGFLGGNNYSALLLANAAYEFNFSSLRLRLGPVAGATYLDYSYSKMTTRRDKSKKKSWTVEEKESCQRLTPTYGWQAGISYDVSENVCLAVDYKYLCFTDSTVKDDNAQSITLALGFNF